MAKQTAVEWLKKELEKHGSPSHLNLDWKTFDELCQQANEMEKQQNEKTLRQPHVISSVCTCIKNRETPVINNKHICAICNKPIH